MPRPAGSPVPRAQHPAGTSLRLCLLGGVTAVAHDGRPLALPAGRARLLLLALALTRGRPVGRSRLVDLLWTADPPPTADNAVQVYVRTLRRALGDAAIRTEAEGYALGPDVEVDVVAVERLLAAGAAAARDGEWDRAADVLGRALDRWPGPLGGDGGDLPWLLAERSRLDVAREHAVLDRLDALVRGGRAREALPDLVPLAREHPLVERVQALLVRALAGVGRREQALAAHAAVRRALADDLGLDPGPDLAAAHAEALAATVPRHPRTPRPGSLPRYGDPLLGREPDVAALVAMVRGAGRLVTVTGAGGVGKTRLAVAVGHALDAAFADGVLWVPLSELDDPDAVPAALVAALGLQVATGTALDAATAHLRGRELLLVIDNFEHVTAASAAVVRLLRAAPGVRVLVTSRVLLRVDGEQPYLLAPLPVPGPVPGPVPVSRPPAGPAEQLLRARLRDLGADPGADLGADPGADPDQATGDVLARQEAAREICRAVDGVPLALELAAARAVTLPLTSIAAALRERPADLHTAEPAGAGRPARQRSLRDTVAWSVDLLSPQARRLLARLSVFRGGCAPASAAAVADHDGLFGGRVEDALAELQDASLVTVAPPSDANGPGRVRMLVMVREYAAGLLPADEVAALRQVHARQAADVLRAVVGDLAQPAGRLHQLRSLLAESDNRRAALDVAQEARDHALLADLVTTMGPLAHSGHDIGAFFTLHDRLDVSALPPATRCDLDLWRASLGRDVGDLAGSLAAARRAVEAAREAHDPDRVALATADLALLLAWNDLPDEGGEQVVEDLLAGGGLHARPALLLWQLGFAAGARGAPDRAERLYRRALAAAEAAGDDLDALLVAGALGECLAVAGRPDEAVRVLARWDLHDLAETLPLHVTYHARARAVAARLVGDHDGFADDLLLVTGTAERVDDVVARVNAVALSGVAAADLDRWADAVRLHAGARRHGAPLETAVAADDCALRVTAAAATQAAGRLDPPALARARAEGEAMDLRSLLDLAVTTSEDLARRR